MTDLWSLPAHTMLAQLESGAVSWVELVESCLRRTDAINPGLNAVVVRDDAAALAEARRVDESRARGHRLGALAGLPYTAKLDYDVAGQATSQGAAVMKDAVAVSDGPMIGRMRAAGAVLIGRTNEPDFGILYHTDSSLYGPTINAWQRDRTPGGSSGGEGVAVSTGMSPLGLGSDIGGSIRGPANHNGICGLKAGFGRYPDALESEPQPLIHEQLFTARGPLARCVADLVLADAVLRGLDSRDPRTVPSLPAAGLGEATGRIGVVYAPTDTAVPDSVRSLLANAAAGLAKQGYEVVEAVLPNWGDLVETYTQVMVHGFGGDVARWSLLHPSVSFFLRHVHALARQGGGGDLGAALGRRYRIAVEFNRFHQKYDALLMPTWADLPFRANALETTEGIDETMAHSRHLYIFNLLGLPAVSLPVGTVDGLPVGAHISSTRHREDVVLAVAADLERAVGGTFTPIDPR